MGEKFPPPLAQPLSGKVQVPENPAVSLKGPEPCRLAAEQEIDAVPPLAVPVQAIENEPGRQFAL